MRLRTSVIAVALASVALLPLVASAEAIGFLGPIIPEAWNRCPVGWGGVIIVFNNLITVGITLLLVFAAPLAIAYAGFLFVVNPVNPSGKEKAKGVLQNTIVGLVIALTAWMIVNAIMAVLYNGTFGSWQSILRGAVGTECLDIPDSLNQSEGGATLPGVRGIGAGGAKHYSLPTNGECTPEKIKTAAQNGGYSLTQSQANTLSCLAIPESSCGRNITGARTVEGKLTSANGMFQIVLGINDQCHNLNIPICTAAAHNAGHVLTLSGNLNCSTAFQGGTVKQGQEKLAAACKAAAKDLNCNASAAACLVKRNSTFSDWTADPRSGTQRACIADYAGIAILKL